MRSAAPHESTPSEPQLFISYAAADLQRAERLYERLAAEKYVVWFDKARLNPGCDWHREIETGCEAAHVIIPLITPRWQKSNWTRFETYGHANIFVLIAEGSPVETIPPPLLSKQGMPFDPFVADEHTWKALFEALRIQLEKKIPARQPRLVNLPHPSNPNFTGRENDLTHIHEKLHEQPSPTLNQIRVLAVTAMGGIGKTSLANEYARRFWRLYPQIFWVDARHNYVTEFAKIFDQLFPDSDLDTDKKAVKALDALNSRDERLLVIDNVENAKCERVTCEKVNCEIIDCVRRWLPVSANTGCRILITSRFSDWAAGISSTPLYLLEPEPSREFLLKRTRRTVEGAELVACDVIAKELGYLPLALEQAAAYIAAGGGITFVDYLRLYRSNFSNLMARGVLGSTHYPDAVLTTWRTTMTKLKPEALGLIRLCAWLAETPIPMSLILAGCSDVLALAKNFLRVQERANNVKDRLPINSRIKPVTNKGEAELRMRDALANLLDYSMVLEANDRTFLMHGLVQTVIRKDADLTRRSATATAQRVATLLEKIYPKNGYDTIALWPDCELLTPHAMHLRVLVKSEALKLDLSALLQLVGSYFLGRGDLIQSEELLSETLATRKGLLGVPQSDLAHSYSELSLLQHYRGKLQEALENCQIALKIREEIKDQYISTSVNNLGCIFQDLRRYVEARIYLERSLEMTISEFGEHDSETSTAFDNLCELCIHTGDLEEARRLCELGLSIREDGNNNGKGRGYESHDIALSLLHLAQISLREHDLKGAGQLFMRALRLSRSGTGKKDPASGIVDAGIGKDHIDTAPIIIGLAELRLAQGMDRKAKRNYQSALAIYDRSRLQDHPSAVEVREHIKQLTNEARSTEEDHAG